MSGSIKPIMDGSRVITDKWLPLLQFADATLDRRPRHARKFVQVLDSTTAQFNGFLHHEPPYSRFIKSGQDFQSGGIILMVKHTSIKSYFSVNP